MWNREPMGPPRSGARLRRRTLLALAAPVLLVAAGLPAAPVTYTSLAEFLADLPDAPGVLDFDSVATDAHIPTGAALADDAGNSLAFTYDIYGFDLMVRADYNTTSPPNYLGLSDEDNLGLFISGDAFTVTFSRPVIAVGAYFLLGEDLFDDEVRITAGGGTASNLAGTQEILTGDDRAYFVGLIASQPFTVAQFTSESSMGEDFPFLFNVDDIISVISEGPVSSVWIGGDAGAWGLPENWSGAVPNAAGAAAIVASDSQITLGAPRTIGSLAVTATDAVLITGGPADILTLDNAGSPASIRVSSGTLRIDAPVSLAGGLTLDVASAATLRLDAPVTSAGGAITKTGQGTARFVHAIDLAGGWLVLQQGEVEAVGVSNGSMELAAGTVMRFTENAGVAYTLDELVLAGAPGAWAAHLDIADSVLIVDGATDPAAVFARLLDQAASGRAGGAWTGQGIVSSTLAGSPEPRTLAVYRIGAQVVLRPALIGDLNDDQFVDGADYLLLDAAFLRSAGEGFYGGDFDLDGNFSADDYYLVDQAYLWQLGAAPASVAAVPEPSAGLALVGAALAGLSRRRRARR